MARTDQKFSVKKRLLSFKHAFRGIKMLFSQEHNARIHLIAALLVVGAGWWLSLSLTEWAIVIICFALVFSTELVNSAVERIVDLVTEDHHPLAGQAKDFAAGAVLWSAMASAVIGLMIFLPKLIKWFNTLS